VQNFVELSNECRKRTKYYSRKIQCFAESEINPPGKIKFRSDKRRKKIKNGCE
jgi:hypothetical protein